MRVRPLLDHDRKQEVCVSASGGENGTNHVIAVMKDVTCDMTFCVSLEKAVSFPPSENVISCAASLQ